MFPAPKIEKHDKFFVVRDDEIPGGTKRRVANCLLKSGSEFVYASPAFGYAQIALAYACRDAGKQATIFTAKREKPHKRTLEAMKAGAKVIFVPFGYLSNVQAKAKEYCGATGATFLPFGFDTPEFINALTVIAKRMPIQPKRVWCAAGSGTLSRALQAAWPDARFWAIAVGATPDAGNAHIYFCPEPFEKDAKVKPPFPSCSNYDAKAWRYIKLLGNEDDLFWNVAA